MFHLHDDTPVINVETGEVKASAEPVVLHAPAIGSCVVVIAYDPATKIGGMAHVMLPGRAPMHLCNGTRKYAENAIDELLKKTGALGASAADSKISLVGGADLLGDCDIHLLVKDSVIRYLAALHIFAGIQRLGGACARSVWLELATGDIYCRENDQPMMKLPRHENGVARGGLNNE